MRWLPREGLCGLGELGLQQLGGFGEVGGVRVGLGGQEAVGPQVAAVTKALAEGDDSVEDLGLGTGNLGED